jgi:YlmC/YmxH family sporulation protein
VDLAIPESNENRRGEIAVRWSEFSNKECVDLTSGEKLRKFSHADLKFNPQTGKIEALLIPVHTSWFKKNSYEVELSWQTIRKVGPEMVIVDSGRRYESVNRKYLPLD